MKNHEIREALKASGMKQWELAEQLNVSEFTFSRKLRTELPEDEKQKILTVIHGYKQETSDYRVVAAKVEKIILFPDEQAADRYCENMKKYDSNFDLLDYDNTGDTYTIRVVESFEDSPMLVSSMTIDNDPNI